MGAFVPDIWEIYHLTLKIQCQGHGKGHDWQPYLKPGVQSMLLFHSMAMRLFFPEIQQMKYFIFKFKVKVTVMAKLYIVFEVQHFIDMLFLACSWQLDHSFSRYSKSNIWPWAFGQGHHYNQPKSNKVIYMSGTSIISKMKEILKVIQYLLCEPLLLIFGLSIKSVHFNFISGQWDYIFVPGLREINHQPLKIQSQVHGKVQN